MQFWEENLRNQRFGNDGDTSGDCVDGNFALLFSVELFVSSGERTYGDVELVDSKDNNRQQKSTTKENISK